MKNYNYWHSSWPLIVSRGLAHGSTFYRAVVTWRDGIVGYRCGRRLSRAELLAMVDHPAQRSETIEVFGAQHPSDRNVTIHPERR